MRHLHSLFLASLFLISPSLATSSPAFKGTIVDFKTEKSFSDVKKFEMDRALGQYNIAIQKDNPVQTENELKISYTGGHDELAGEIKVKYSPEEKSFRIYVEETSTFFQRQHNMSDLSKLVVTISLPEKVITRLNLTAANVSIVGSLEGEATLDISGTGEIKLDELSCPKAVIRIAGAGNIEMGNLETQMLDAKISGNGNLNIEASKLKKASLDISGSGNVHMERSHIDDVIKASVAGIGNVEVSGYIKDVVARVSGVGNIDISKVSGQVSKSMSGTGRIDIGK